MSTSGVPSPFARLLRRSKLASFDPSIGQVYTSYGGHAYRGNWGLKRPLPNRRRVGFITVRTIDSPEQQTEWNSAESSARWMTRWEELGKEIKVEDSIGWGSKNPHSWTIDSEFDRGGKVGLEPGRERESERDISDWRNLILEPDSMTIKQFDKYLNRLRALRPEFKKFLQECRAEEVTERAKTKSRPRLGSEQRSTNLKAHGSGQVDMYGSAQGHVDGYITKFLEQKAKDDIYAPQSRRIEPRPHTFAGLEYTYMTELQSSYLHKAAPGRNIAQNIAERYSLGMRREKLDFIAVGGLVGTMPSDTSKLLPTDYGTRTDPRRDREQGKAFFRLSEVRLVDPPITVGRKPQTADCTNFSRVYFNISKLGSGNRSNPYPLGSMDYISHEDITQGKNAALGISQSFFRRTQMAQQQAQPSQPNYDQIHHTLMSLMDGSGRKRQKSSLEQTIPKVDNNIV